MITNNKIKIYHNLLNLYHFMTENVNYSSRSLSNVIQTDLFQMLSTQNTFNCQNRTHSNVTQLTEYVKLLTQNIFKCYSNCRTLSIKNTKRFEMLFNEQNPFKFITENTFNCYSNRAVSITQTQTLSLIQSLASLAKADVLCR